MKTTLLIFGLMLASTLGFAQNVIRVQNGQNLQTIISSNTLVAGSVLLLDPGSYGDVNVTKRVSIIGSGYFNGGNESTVGRVEFGSTSAGSLITGCNAYNISINANNISATRNRVYYTSGGIGIGNATSGVIVRQNFVLNDITTYDDPSSFQVSNNIVLGQIVFSSAGTGLAGIVSYNTVLGVEETNCSPISYNTSNNGVVVSNNIFVSGPTCTNNNTGTANLGAFTNNLYRQGNYQSPSTSNVSVVTDNMTTLLFQNQGAADMRYQLSANSPAKGIGAGGTDCGAFGGADPYVLSGAPAGPIIQELQVPTTARQNETIQIRLRARIQN